jgi:hypothetical protein
MILAHTADRVNEHTPDSINERIAAKTQASIDYYREHRDEIPARLGELDREWDIERCLAAGSTTLTITGLLLGAFVDKRWLILSGVVQGFYLQHTVQGWCPPLPAFRAAGVRTCQEIEAERHALEKIAAVE